ncbi:MAG: HDOD domain-containing protein [Gammaproteobacteria bacterium]|nr:HDOD domain-containing protein [Gammaproteobacteria bacterium]
MARNKISLQKLLEQKDALPSLPEIYTQASDQLEDTNSSIDEIGETIANDPAISYKILVMVNSAFFGLPNKISSIEQAITLLGRERVKQVLIGALLGDIFKGLDSKSFSLKDFWQHSIRTAIIARFLANDSDYVDDPDIIFTSGLLHDVGRLILAVQMPEVLPEIMLHAHDTGLSIVQAELDIIGISHAEIGGALMLKWDFPDLIWVCVSNHHHSDYTGAFYYSAHLVYLANQLAYYAPPSDVNQTLQVLNNITNWRATNTSISTVFLAIQKAEEMVFDVMKSLGMD